MAAPGGAALLLEQPAALITLEASSACSVPQTACIARDASVQPASAGRRRATLAVAAHREQHGTYVATPRRMLHPAFLRRTLIIALQVLASAACFLIAAVKVAARFIPPRPPRTARPRWVGSVSSPIDCTRPYGLCPRRYVQPSAAHGHDAASPPRDSRGEAAPRVHRCSARRGVVSRWSVSALHVSGAGGDCPTRRGQGAQPRPPQSDRPTLRCAARPVGCEGHCGDAPMAMAVLARLLRGVC